MFAECGVAAVVVVGVEEVCQGCASFVVGGVGPQVGPFVQERAVEAFDLAVGLGTVGAGEFAGRAEVGQDGLPGPAFAVGPRVVRQDAFDARGMPWLWKNAAARVRKPAQVATFSSAWISL